MVWRVFCISWIPVYQKCFLQRYFSQSMFCLFILPFAEQEFLILLKPNLAIFLSFTLYLKSHHQSQDHVYFSYIIFQKFYSFWLTFGSMMHFGLIFVKGLRSVSTFSCSGGMCWKDYHFSTELPLCLCQILTISVWVYSGLSTMIYWPICLSLHQYCLLYYLYYH